MAAVVGVIANLSLWFALHFLFATVGTSGFGPFTLVLPDPGSVKPLAVGLALFSGGLLLVFHQPLWRVLALSAAASALLSGL
jgi:chromate transporter